MPKLIHGCAVLPNSSFSLYSQQLFSLNLNLTSYLPSFIVTITQWLDSLLIMHKKLYNSFCLPLRLIFWNLMKHDYFLTHVTILMMHSAACVSAQPGLNSWEYLLLPIRRIPNVWLTSELIDLSTQQCQLYLGSFHFSVLPFLVLVWFPA